ncbi:RagB/SusD family nutrient uptake outer membrane protein [Puia sp. P3]|uniref:RagB/SusD family nutrient uptake outer membrane protein n=1 Tax=Puia sp. P3 TaxID=3423952 RepID=UPI003D678AB3
MDKVKYLFVILVIAVSASCHKLDTPPLGVIAETDVFTNANAVQAYMANVYTMLPIEDFIYEPNHGFMTGDGGRWQCFYHTDAIDGEMVGPFGGTGDAAQGFGYWPYDKIRIINVFISTLPLYAKNFTQDQVNQWLGEAYFCRAYTYFALAKRYGGVPIVRTVVDPATPIASLQVPRNKEEDVYNFIASDFDSAFALMKDPGSSATPGLPINMQLLPISPAPCYMRVPSPNMVLRTLSTVLPGSRGLRVYLPEMPLNSSRQPMMPPGWWKGISVSIRAAIPTRCRTMWMYS